MCSHSLQARLSACRTRRFPRPRWFAALLPIGRLAPWFAESQRAVWPGEEWDQLRLFVESDLIRAVREVRAGRETDEGATSLEEVEGFAERLGLPSGVIVRAIWELVESGEWTYRQPRLEREHRLVEGGTDLSKPGTVRVQRGHVTRRMEREIQQKIKENDGQHHEGEERVAGTLADS